MLAVPSERAAAALKSAPSPATPATPAPPSIGLASFTRLDTALPAAIALPRSLVAAPPPEVTWGLASLALATGIGWLVERRGRLHGSFPRDSRDWRSTPAQSTRRNSGSGAMDETFPDGRNIVTAAPPVYVSAIGDTPSRREATLVDLHELQQRLLKLVEKRNPRAAAELLEEHLVDFRYSSPWVFLELRELYKQIDHREEWELVRDAFRSRFGQNAPRFNGPSTAGSELAEDKQLSDELLRKWPHREARMFILRWMLGDAQSRVKNSGPPQLGLGVYRDMLLVDSLLDEVMISRAVPERIAA
ncbi:MAG: hypothetical protein NVS3B2_15130 [Ramlibacter sp.]